MLNLRRRLKRLSPPPFDRRVDGEKSSATFDRASRAEQIRQLQSEVHRLQHQIADVSTPQPPDAAGDVPAIDQRHVHELEAELTRTQRTLASLQGRV